ncbi:hypothetical protein BASA83_001011 [Batrachochytrium salamandrivorans]|nr:hypothetical protein BASA62_007266 [Batrachochytrium salamandrivorans]KAH9276323.1 hypothetical protein BASA83_001011 [Batrachochytrium salamandrivorans]
MSGGDIRTTHKASRSNQSDDRTVKLQDGEKRNMRNSPSSARQRRSESPNRRHRRSLSPQERRTESRRETANSPGNGEHQFGKRDEHLDSTASTTSAVQSAPKEAPNFAVSGALAADVNTFKGVVLKYSEPPEARKPSRRYRLYVFKGKDQVDMLHIHRQSAFLLGRERLVADIPIDHPSCSKQHSVIQFRQIVSTDEFGQVTKSTKPYIIDLDSANGTFVGGERIPPSRYYELKPGDLIKFGFSTREYVLMNEDMAE